MTGATMRRRIERRELRSAYREPRQEGRPERSFAAGVLRQLRSRASWAFVWPRTVSHCITALTFGTRTF